MKIESSKTTQAEKKIAPSDKSKTTFQTLFNQTEKPDSPPPARFAKILEEARNQNARDKDSLTERKAERGGQNSETAEAGKDEETGGTIQNQEKVEEENKRHGDEQESEQSDGQNENLSFALLGLQSASKPLAETTIPAARSILHVADLERIVSTVRAQNLKNAEQLVIALKHSVLEGLQIKLTIDQNGTLKAEFLALNEQIKNHLDARKQEITQIFRERGIKLSDLNVRQGSEFAPPTNHSEDDSIPDETSGSQGSDGATETEDSGDQTSYRI